MRSQSLLFTLLSAAIVFTAPAQAQITRETLDYVGELAGAPPRNGHDKCKGNGHNGGSNGGGHDEAECYEEGEGPGPVASEACFAGGEVAPESAWQRYSCTLVTYNEDYFTGTIEANEGYPEVLAEYATTEALALQGDTTTFVETVAAEMIAADLVGVAEATDSYLGALTRYLPAYPTPTPGPIITEALVYSNDTVLRISQGDYAGAVEQTQSFISGATRYLPAYPTPTPGPIITEALVYSNDTVLRISQGDYAGAVEQTQSFISGAAARYLPAYPTPTPGPVITEYRLPEMPATTIGR